MPFTLAAFSATGNTTAGNATITGVSNTTNVFVGMSISGPGIANGTTVSSFVANTSITVNAASNITATATGVALFGGRITQTGTDTLNNSTAAPAGMTITDRGLFRIFTCPYDLLINGTLTVDQTTASLQNVSTAQSLLNITAVGGTAAGLVINGNRAAANNGPMVQTGLWWFGRINLSGVSSSVLASLTLTNATIITNNIASNANSRVITIGDRVNILNASGTGTNVSRMTGLSANVADFRATVTYCGIWMNVSANGTSYLGATPVNVDGIEVNTNGSGRVLLRNYNPSFCNGAFYPGSQIVIIANSWARLINSPLGTNVNSWISNSGGSSGGKTLASVVDFAKDITATCQDTSGNRLNGGYLYWQPSGSNVTTITTNIGDPVYDFSQQAVQFSGSGTATTQWVYAWKWSSAGGYGFANRTYIYFCTGTTLGAETMTMFASTYGYTKVSQTVPMFGNDSATPTFTQVSLPTTDKVIANGGAVTGVAFNFVARTITISGNVTYQGLYDHLQFQLNQIANLQVADPSTASGTSLSFTTGWSMTVNAGATLSPGGNFASLTVPTTATSAALNNNRLITNLSQATPTNLTGLNLTGNLTFNTNTDITVTFTNCTITGTISNSGTGIVTITNSGSTLGTIGTNVVTRLAAPLTITGLTTDSAVGLYNGSGAQVDYVASGLTSYTYDATGGAGTWTVKVRRYGFQDQAFTFTPAAGAYTTSAVYIPDTFVSDTLSNVIAYTDLQTTQKVYDYSRFFATTATGMALAPTFDKGFGTLTANGGYTTDPAASVLLAVSGGVITTKTSGFAETTTIVVLGDFTQGTATLSNDVKIRANNLDSELLFSGIDSLTIYATQSNALTNTSPGATSSTGIIRFKFGAALSGVTMSGTVYVRTLLGSAVQVQPLTLVAGTNTLDLSTTSLLQSVLTSVDAVPADVWSYDTRTINKALFT